MSKGVAITGMGIISAIGNNVAENYQSLISEKKGISRISKIQTNHKNDIMVGEIDYTNENFEKLLNISSDNNYSRNNNTNYRNSNTNHRNNNRQNYSNSHSRNTNTNFNTNTNSNTNTYSNNKTKLSDITLENSLNKISFCDKECFNINNNHTKELIVNHIQSKYKIKIIDREYVNLNPHMIRNVANHEHYLATYSNGNPYLLWFTKIDNKNCAIFIDRKLKDGYSYPKIHLVQYEFDDIIFKNEFIFTGELVRDVNREWQYLISDLIVYEGENINKTQNILSRFNLIYKILDNHYTPNILIESCPLYVKKLWQYSDFNKLVKEYLPSLSYICKGIVFYTMNTQFSSYAWIMPRESQIRVDNAKIADIRFYEKYPEYKDIGSLIPNNTLDSSSNSIHNQHTYNMSSIIYSHIISNNILNNTTKFILTDTDMLQMLSKIEKCIKTICNESTILNMDDLKFNKFSIYKSTIPGIFKVYDNKLEEQGILYIPYLKMEKTINEMFKDKIESFTIKMNCIYYELYNKWIPITYDI